MESTPRRKLYPPHWTLLLLVGELALGLGLPIVRVIPWPWNLTGIPVALAGLAFGGWAFSLFRRAKTGIVPFSEATRLVASGPYRFSRNPMYVGMTSLLVGVAILLGSATPFVAPVAFVLIVTYRFIVPEEAQMARTFGAEYAQLKQRVRRWL